jgi:hypothetical protein
MDIKEEIAKRKKEEWYELMFSIEALAIDKELVETSIKEHILQLEKAPGVFVYEKKFYDCQEVKNPMKDVEKAYSQAVVLKLFIKDLHTMLISITLFGPSSIEVLGPHKKEISLSEAQNIANNIAGLVHQFAAAGIGGIVITPSGAKTGTK